MNREEIKKVIELFKDWYEDNAEHTFDLFDRSDYVADSFLDSEQAEELMQLQQKTITEEQIEEACYEICGRNHGTRNLYKRIGFWAGYKWAIEKLK